MDDSKPFQQSGNLISINTFEAKNERKKNPPKDTLLLNLDSVNKDLKSNENSGNSTPVQDEPRDQFEAKMSKNTEEYTKELNVKQSKAIDDDDRLDAISDFDDDNSEPDIEVELRNESMFRSSSLHSDELILSVSENRTRLDSRNQNPAEMYDEKVSPDCLDISSEKEKLQTSLEKDVDIEFNAVFSKSKEAEAELVLETSHPPHPKSSLSFDGDDILNFDLDDLNDLDSFLDKHTSVEKIDAKEILKPENKSSEQPAKDVENKPINSEKLEVVNKNIQSNEPKSGELKLQDELKSKKEILVKTDKSDEKKNAIQENGDEKKSIAKNVAKHDKIVFSAPGSPSCHSQDNIKEKKDISQSSFSSPEKPARKINIKDSPQRKTVPTKRESKLMENLDKELEAFKAGLDKIEVHRKPDKNAKRKPVQYTNLDFGPSGKIDKDLFKKQSRDDDCERKKKRERKRSASREKKRKHRKRRRSSTPPTSESSESFVSSDELEKDSQDSSTNPKYSDLEAMSSESSDDSFLSDDRKKKKRKSKNDRERRKKLKAELKRKISKDSKKSKKRVKRELNRDEGKRTKRPKDFSENGEDEDEETLPTFRKTIKLSHNYEDFSDDGDPYSHLKPSSDLDSGSTSTKLTANFRIAADEIENDDDVIDFEEDDDIFKIADIEKTGKAGIKSGSKKLTQLERLKLKHNQVSYSDDDCINNEGEVETLFGRPKVMMSKNSLEVGSNLAASSLGRRVMVQKSPKSKARRIGELSKETKPTESTSDPESISTSKASRAISGLNVKDRLTLTTKLQKSISSNALKGSSGRVAELQTSRSVHSRLGSGTAGSRGSKSSAGHNNNNALSRFL